MNEQDLFNYLKRITKYLNEATNVIASMCVDHKEVKTNQDGYKITWSKDKNGTKE